MFGFITRPIGCLFSLIGSIVVFALVLLVAAYALVAWFMPQIAATAVSEATGFPTSIGSTSLSLWKQSLELKSLRIDNPPSYPEDDFLDIRSVAVTLDRKATTAESLVFSAVVLDIDTLTLVNLSPAVINGNTLIRNLLQNASLNPQQTAASAAFLQGAAGQGGNTFGGQPQGGGFENNVPHGVPIQPYGGAARQPDASTGSKGATGQQQGGVLHFQPIEPPAQIAIPQLQTLPAPVVAQAGDPAEQPRWLMRRLTVRINSARLFQSNPQGSVLIHLPLRYEREFENVTSLRQVLPELLLDLQRRNIPLAPAGF